MIAFNWRISLKALRLSISFIQRIESINQARWVVHSYSTTRKLVLEGHFTGVTRVSGDGAHP